ncbi:MAG: ComEC/Rec2 family competence protein, partial [Bacteroidota bacterium]
FPYAFPGQYYLFGSLLLIYGVLVFLLPSSWKKNTQVGRGINAAIIVILFGFLRTQEYDGKQDSLQTLPLSKIKSYTARITSSPEEKTKTYRYDIIIDKYKQGQKWYPARAQAILYLGKDSSKALYAYGDQILILGEPQDISSPKNPKAFDYQKFLRYQNIFYQDFAAPEEVLLIQKRTRTNLFYLALASRQYLQSLLQVALGNGKEYAVASALMLGKKDQLDKDIRQAYASTGLMHILAVSGLHVGFIAYLLHLIFQKWRKRRFGKWLYISALLSGLWLYALITGFSPSVLRAATMFSFVVIAKSLNRPRLIYNNLGASAFLLLSLNPFFLLSLGFQLSYLALLGIVFFQPPWERMLDIPNYWLRKIWALTTVSLAAQLATAPLTIFYFHQFPNFFLISNLLVLPLVPLILYLGIALFLSAPIPLLFSGFSWLLKQSIWLVNSLIFYLESWPGARSNHLYLQAGEVILLYGLIISLSLLFSLRRFKYLILGLTMVLAFALSRFNWEKSHWDQSFLAIYHLKGGSHVHLVEGKESYLFLEIHPDSLENEVDFQLNNFWLSRGIPQPKYLQFSQWGAFKEHIAIPAAAAEIDGLSWLIWKKQKFLWVKQALKGPLLQKMLSLKPDYLILSDNSFIELKAIENMEEKPRIIIDLSNRFSFQNKVRAIAQKKGIPVYQISQKGAFIIDDQGAIPEIAP